MKKSFLLPLILIFAEISAFAEEMTAQRLAEIFADNDRVPDFSYALLYIDNILPDGEVSDHMVVNEYGSGLGNDLKNLVVEFKSPAKVKNMRVLQSQKVKKQDDRWVYMPALKSVRRIPMSERYKVFAGEYTYNDMTVREPHEDVNKILDHNAAATVNGKTYSCWKLESEPIKKSEVEYGYRISYFDKETYLPVRIEYYDKKDSSKMVKLYEITEVEWVTGETGIKYPLRRENMLTNLSSGRKTRIRVANFKFDEPISDSYFTQSFLQTGKAKK
ncbi:MAG: outer membrane lipoprotein-sorting protein [Treponema sp.]|nr:outer membrane lipoprotein-sorting protein [Treponema sp.]